MFYRTTLALLCLLAGCSGAAPRPGSTCVAGDPGGSMACQAVTYGNAR
jgi:hypothetical protein